MNIYRKLTPLLAKTSLGQFIHRLFCCHSVSNALYVVFFITLLLPLGAHADRIDAKWNELVAWEKDQLTDAWPAFLNSCIKLEKKPSWARVCSQAKQINASSVADISDFFKQNFQLEQLINNDGSDWGLITGYYEPVISINDHQTDVYRFPIYGPPANLKRADDQRIIAGTSNTPYFDREYIETHPDEFKESIISWTDNPHRLFMLHVQGSGSAEYPDGRKIKLSFADHNGHGYVSLGKVILRHKAMVQDDINLFSLLNWMDNNPQKAREYMHENPRYIFFQTNSIDQETVGSLNVPLTPERSLAIDPKVVELGSPIWIDSTLPDGSIFRRLMFAQDTGAAIKGNIRADVFFGPGIRAENMAGEMKQDGHLFVFKPKP